MGGSVRPHAMLQAHEGQIGAMDKFDGVEEAHDACEVGAGSDQQVLSLRSVVAMAYKMPAPKAADTLSFF